MNSVLSTLVNSVLNVLVNSVLNILVKSVLQILVNSVLTTLVNSVFNTLVNSALNTLVNSVLTKFGRKRAWRNCRYAPGLRKTSISVSTAFVPPINRVGQVPNTGQGRHRSDHLTLISIFIAQNCSMPPPPTLSLVPAYLHRHKRQNPKSAKSASHLH